MTLQNNRPPLHTADSCPEINEFLMFSDYPVNKERLKSHIIIKSKI